MRSIEMHMIVEGDVSGRKVRLIRHSLGFSFTSIDGIEAVRDQKALDHSDGRRVQKT